MTTPTYSDFWKLGGQALLDHAKAGHLTPGQLSESAETIGRELDTPEAMEYLIGLLRHDRPIVREGALYGLHYHPDNPTVIGALRAHLLWEENETLREIADDFLAQITPCPPTTSGWAS